jgi:heme/copper-type cytochrome/quinol oxidase subunit 3
MTAATPTSPARDFESATRIALVAALSATSMLFASLASAYLVRRSFADWRPARAWWPFVLLTFAFAASWGIEVATRNQALRRAGLMGLALGSGLYLLGALSVIGSVVSGASGLTMPFNAFVVLLLGVHAVHAILGGAFAFWILRAETSGPSHHALSLARGLTHFLTALLCAIVFLLFGLQ